MSEILLRTKLLLPPSRPNLVPRPRLVESLNQGIARGCKLTLVSAPAGFGKTTLLGEWAANMRSEAPPESGGVDRVAWLSLDEKDGDPARFLAYMAAALDQVKGIEHTIGKGAQGMLQSARPPPSDDILISLLNDLTAIPDRIILIFDDYHLLDSSAVDEALTFLLEHLPPQLHLVIATRVDPELPLARLRAQGLLSELRGTHLRFTSAEAAEFLNRVMGLNLSAEDASALERRTEGWIAGLQLAAISMHGRKDSSNFIKSFTGSHRFVMDYLIEDVLQQQPQNVRAFLLQTAVLNRLTGSLCNALTGQDDGQRILESLEHSNLFIVPLDEERRWYRYHHLFSDLLLRRLRQTQPDSVLALHDRASRWFAQSGFAAEAIEHAVQAGNFERSAYLLKGHIDALWGRGDHSKLQRWLDRLPEDVLLSEPYIGIFQARYQCNSGRLEAAERTLTAVENAINTGGDRSDGGEPEASSLSTPTERAKLKGRAAATRAIMCNYQGDVSGIIQHARQALELLPDDDLTWRSVTAIVLGNAHGFAGDMNAAYEARSEASHAAKAAGDTFFVLLANLEVAITVREQGRLQRTVEICRQQLQFADENGLSQSRAVGWLLAVWGETLAELNELDGAIDRAQKGFVLAERSGDRQMLGWSFMCLVRILISRGELDSAEQMMQKMDRLARQTQLPPWVIGRMAAWQARLWLAQDRLDAAAKWASESGLYSSGELKQPDEVDFFLLSDYVVLARVLRAQGRLDEATRVLQHIHQAAEACGRISKVIEIRILQALTLQAQNRPHRALSALKRALALAEPEGFTRIFVDEGPPMARLLHDALTHEVATHYVRQLLAAFPVSDPEQAAARQPASSELDWIEPLSDRELEVLQLIAEGLANRQIADRLYLSLNTVKAHTRNIYGKLGVHSRTQAVVRARELALLPAI